MRLQRLLIVPVLLVMINGCGDPAPDRETLSRTDPVTPADPATPAAVESDHDHADGEPMAFLAIMRQLSVDLNAFTHALWLEDYAQMSERARAIAHHPPTDPADRERFQQILGDEWAGFQEADHVVHEASEELHEAVEEGDLGAILDRLNDLQRGCVSCHTDFRDRLLSEGSTVRRP